MSRRTNGRSKTWANREAMPALPFAADFRRRHQTSKTAPAVKHGLTSDVRSIERRPAEAAQAAA